MRVIIRGDRNKKLKKRLKHAAEFYASLLMSKRMISSLDLSIELRRKLDGDVDGFCSYEDKENGVRYFEIEMQKKRSIEEQLTILAHEMVHLKQYATGEMKNGKITASRTVWQGQTIHDHETDYWDQPWEIEAFGRERGLFVRYVDKFGWPE